MAQLQPGMRALKVRRISRDTEDSSALARQAEDLNNAVHDHRLVVAGDVEDSTVSGAVNLDERKSLGKWMREPLWHEWDVMAVTALDRITRDQHHWDRFAERCHKGGKEILCLDDPSLDIHTPTGRMIAYVKATQAQEYREAIVRKRLNQTRYYRDESLWGGGTWPFGYRPVPQDHHGKPRYKLVIDPVTGPLIREAYERIVEQGWNMSRVCQDWNARGVLTSQDYQRSVNAEMNKPGVKTHIKGTRWTTSTLGKMLKKPTLKGIAVHKGEPLLKDGMPVRWAGPLLTDEEFEKLQIAVRELGKYRAGIKSNASPMAGVLFCPCGKRMYENVSESRLKGGEVRKLKYFRCSSWANGDACPFSVSWQQEKLYAMAERAFLDKLGAEEITERTYIPGKDNRAQIRELEAAIENLAQSVALASSPAVVQSLTATMERHAASLESLKAEPFIPGRWEVKGTGQTYADKWTRMQGWLQRGPFLRNAGFRLFVWGHPKDRDKDEAVYVITPTDVAERAGRSVEPGEEREWDLQALTIFLEVLSLDISRLEEQGPLS